MTATVNVSDAAGNHSTLTVQQAFDVQTSTLAQFLGHLGANLNQSGGPADAYGKKGAVSRYQTSDNDDFIYIGYTGFDAKGQLIQNTKTDGDFERDCGDGNVVWTLNTGNGNDFVQTREDQNAYTIARLGGGNDQY